MISLTGVFAHREHAGHIEIPLTKRILGMSCITYQLPGLKMSVRAQPERVQLALEWLFQVCPKTLDAPDLHLEAVGTSLEHVIDAIPDWVRMALPSNDPEAPVIMIRGQAHESAAAGWFDGMLFCAWTDAESHIVRLFCGMKDDVPTRSIIPSVIFPILRDVMLRQRQFMLHSAAVKCPNGLGLQFIALSGGGKTTTCLSLVRLGAKLLADDLVVVALEGNKPMAYGLPKPLNLREPTLGYFEELRERVPKMIISDEKSSIIPQLVYGTACLAPSCAIDVLYFLNLTDDGPALRRLDAGAALERLIHTHVFCAMQPTLGDSIVGLFDLLAMVPFYQLDTGRDPGYLGQWLLEHCQQHAQGGSTGGK